MDRENWRKVRELCPLISVRALLKLQQVLKQGWTAALVAEREKGKKERKEKQGLNLIIFLATVFVFSFNLCSSYILFTRLVMMKEYNYQCFLPDTILLWHLNLLS